MKADRREPASGEVLAIGVPEGRRFSKPLKLMRNVGSRFINALFFIM
jgi:hypothetical protein